MTPADLVTHIDHFQRRVIQDAIAEATAAYWLRRAEMFEWARPRPGEADTDGIDRRCRASADACRAKAAVLLGRLPSE